MLDDIERVKPKYLDKSLSRHHFVKFYVDLVNTPRSDMMLSIIEVLLQARALLDCGSSDEKKCEITRIWQTREVPMG